MSSRQNFNFRRCWCTITQAVFMLQWQLFLPGTLIIPPHPALAWLFISVGVWVSVPPQLSCQKSNQIISLAGHARASLCPPEPVVGVLGHMVFHGQIRAAISLHT